MTRARRVVALASILLPLAACTDYHFKGSSDGSTPFDTGSTLADTGAGDSTVESCPSGVLPGFPGSSDETCAAAPVVGTFDPVVEWSWTENADFPGYAQVMATPAVGDIDGDGIPDIVFTAFTGENWNGTGDLVALSGDGSGVKFDLAQAGGHHFQGAAGVALGDLDGDGSPEICVPSDSAALVCLASDGSFEWAAGTEASHYGAPAIADLDGDGRAEVILGRQVFDADGNVLSVGAGGKGSQNAWWDGTDTALSFAADMDDDGVLDIVAGNTVYRMDGSVLWNDGGPDGFPAVADFDDDGLPEVVKVSGGTVTLTDTDGRSLWTVNPNFGGYGGPPTVADFDGDGEPEIGVAGANFYTVLRRDGSTLWQMPVSDVSSNMTGSSVFDFEGDGAAEVVYADEHTLWVFSGATGAVELQDTDHASATAFEYPVIADVDSDGSADIVLGSNNSYYPGWNGIHVIGDAARSWRPGRPVWNQHAYSITNVNDDLSIPRVTALNWASYNNFRSGDPATGFGVAEPNPTLSPGDVCETDCAEGRLVVWIYPGNTGAVEEGPGSTVSLYGVNGGIETLLETKTLAALPAGAFADSLVFDEHGVGPTEKLIARITPSSLECVADDDEVVLVGPYCP